MTVATDHRHAVTRVDAERVKCSDQPTGALPHLAVGQRHLAAANRDPVGRDLHRPPQRPDQRCHA